MELVIQSSPCWGPLRLVLHLQFPLVHLPFKNQLSAAPTWFCLYLCLEVMAHILVVMESWFHWCLFCVHFLAILLKIEYHCSVSCSCTYTALFTIQYIPHLIYLGVLFALLSVFLTIGLLYREQKVKKIRQMAQNWHGIFIMSLRLNKVHQYLKQYQAMNMHNEQ